MSNLKVVTLNSREPSGQGGGDRPEPLVHQLRRLLTDHLGQATRRMMERVDDALFELAEKSDNTATQSLYFDAMREVRLKRASLEESFRREFQSRFNARIESLKAPVTTHGGPHNPVAETRLGLLDDDTVEEDIAVANLVDKINNGCREQIYALERRMAAILGVTDATGILNPSGPEVVCQSIRTALADLQSGIKVRLIILKLFDRYVAAELEGIYLDCNQFLIRQGILPDLRPSSLTQPGRRTWTRPPATSEGDPAVGVTSMDEQTIVAALRSLLTGGAGPGGGGGAAAGALLGALGPISTSAVTQSLGGLTELQRGSASAWSTTVTEDVAWAEGMRGEVNVLRSLKGTGLTAPLGQAGDLTIDIVAMLFDYILDDRNIPSALRALIGRLQIPVVKVALLDASFFSKKNHPARRLLNTLAEASVAWAGEALDTDPLYAGIEAAVARINREFEQDVALFAQVLDDFERLLAAGIAQRNERDERTRGVVQDRERTEEAKRFAREAVAKHSGDSSIPEPVRNFLTHHWGSVLIHLGSACGVDSEAFQDGLQTMDSLVASIRPHTTPESRRRLSAALPSLLAKLKVGMDQIEVPPIARKGFLTKLAKCHAEAVRGTAQPGPAPTMSADFAQFEAFIATDEAPSEVAPSEVAPITQVQGPPAVMPEAPAAAAPVTPFEIDVTEHTAPLALEEATQPLEPTLPDADRRPQADPPDAECPAPLRLSIAEPEPALHFSVDSGPVAERALELPEQTRAADQPLISEALERTLPLSEPADAEALNEAEPDHPAPATQATGYTLPPLDPSCLLAGSDSDRALSTSGALGPRGVEATSQPRESLADVLRERLLYDAEVPLSSLIDPALIEERLSRTSPSSTTDSKAARETPAAAAGFDLRTLSTEQILELMESGDLDVEEVTLAEQAGEPSEMLGCVDQFTTLVAQLETGTWLEFLEEDGNKRQARLTWVNSATDVFMFTDRRGHKVQDRTRNGLVADFRRGAARVVEQTASFDMWVGRIMEGLGKAVSGGR